MASIATIDRQINCRKMLQSKGAKDAE